MLHNRLAITAISVCVSVIGNTHWGNQKNWKRGAIVLETTKDSDAFEDKKKVTLSATGIEPVTLRCPRSVVTLQSDALPIELR